MKTTLFILSLSTLTFAVEPTPQSPSQEKVEKIQKSGGALKLEDPMPVEEFKSHDPAMGILDKATQDNLKTVQAEETEHLFAVDAALGLPHPLNVGLVFIHSSRLFSAEANTGSFSLKQQGADVKMENWDVSLRWHPWSNAFYVGFGMGHQKLDVKDSDTVGATLVTAKASLDTPYTLPQIGWLWGTKNLGFFWGMQLAWQIPSSHKTKITTNVDLTGTPGYDDLVADVKKQGDDLGKISIPNLALFKFGWIF